MTGEEIIALATALAIILIGGALLVVYLIKIAPKLAEAEESRINKELIRAKFEIKQKKKLITALINELALKDEQLESAEKHLAQLETDAFYPRSEVVRAMQAAKKKEENHDAKQNE